MGFVLKDALTLLRVYAVSIRVIGILNGDQVYFAPILKKRRDAETVDAAPQDFYQTNPMQQSSGFPALTMSLRASATI
jgi:hypothetical protein